MTMGERTTIEQREWVFSPTKMKFIARKSLQTKFPVHRMNDLLFKKYRKAQGYRHQIWL